MVSERKAGRKLRANQDRASSHAVATMGSRGRGSAEPRSAIMSQGESLTGQSYSAKPQRQALSVRGLQESDGIN